jgi:6-phosphogluconolactonase
MTEGGVIAVSGENAGLHAFELRDGTVAVRERLAPIEGVISLAVSHDRSHVFATVNGTPQDEEATGAVAAFRVTGTRERVSLEPIGRAPTGGTTPCHAAVVGSAVLVANFRRFGGLGGPGATSRGSVGVVRLEADELWHESTIHFPGESVHPERQTCSHPHCVLATGHRAALVADLGTDRIWRVIVPEPGTYPVGGEPEYEEALELPAGSGPRHLASSPDGGELYVVNEIASTLATCRVDGGGRVALSGTASILPPSPQGEAPRSRAGDVAVTRDGSLVLASNRGRHSIAVVDPSTGTPQVRGHLPLSASPGDFVVSSSGHIVVPTGDSLVVARIDEAKATLAEPAVTEGPGPITAVSLLG